MHSSYSPNFLFSPSFFILIGYKGANSSRFQRCSIGGETPSGLWNMRVYCFLLVLLEEFSPKPGYFRMMSLHTLQCGVTFTAVLWKISTTVMVVMQKGNKCTIAHVQNNMKPGSFWYHSKFIQITDPRDMFWSILYTFFEYLTPTQWRVLSSRMLCHVVQ
jgi:hypothetical protein